MIRLAVQEGIGINQRSIGFHVSIAAIDMLEIYLHREGWLSLSASIKHEWFSSQRRAEEKIPWEFEHKKVIIAMIVDIETKRNLLVYGKQQTIQSLADYLVDFNKLREFFSSLGVDDG